MNNGTVNVSVEYRKSKQITAQDQREEMIDVENNGEKTAEVGVGLSMTINLGNYQSAKVDVHVKLPSEPDKASLEGTYTEAAEFCKEHIKKEVASIRAKK